MKLKVLWKYFAFAFFSWTHSFVWPFFPTKLGASVCFSFAPFTAIDLPATCSKLPDLDERFDDRGHFWKPVYLLTLRDYPQKGSITPCSSVSITCCGCQRWLAHWQSKLLKGDVQCGEFKPVYFGITAAACKSNLEKQVNLKLDQSPYQLIVYHLKKI